MSKNIKWKIVKGTEADFIGAPEGTTVRIGGGRLHGEYWARACRRGSPFCHVTEDRLVGGLNDIYKHGTVIAERVQVHKKRVKGAKFTPKTVTKIILMYAPEFSKGEKDPKTFMVKNPVMLALNHDTVSICTGKDIQPDSTVKLEVSLIPVKELIAIRVVGPDHDFVWDMFNPDGKIVMTQLGADFVIEKANVSFIKE